ncbi:unnamed protein product [Amoebophrya sp. A25]|nr:unnamed protein product [Amoebophrya sp. A25]|eukprot:GSA25T00002992001.1
MVVTHKYEFQYNYYLIHLVLGNSVSTRLMLARTPTS